MQCGKCRKTSSGRLSCNDRSGAENLIRGHGPLRSCIKRRNQVLKLDTFFLMQCGRCRKTSGGRLSCDDRSGAETLILGHGPLRSCIKKKEPCSKTWHSLFNAMRKMSQNVRWTFVLRRPKRSGDLGPMGTRSPLPLKKKGLSPKA